MTPPLSDDLSAADDRELAAAADARDRRIALLLRRWPRLPALEMQELRRVYRERIRIARLIGSRRSGVERPQAASGQATSTGGALRRGRPGRGH